LLALDAPLYPATPAPHRKDLRTAHPSVTAPSCGSLSIFDNESYRSLAESYMTPSHPKCDHVVTEDHQYSALSVPWPPAALVVASVLSTGSCITYSTSKPANPVSRPLFLGTTNLPYAFLILLLLNKEPTYVVLTLDLEDISISFLHVRALYLTYSTTESDKPPRATLFFALKKALSWHCYINNYLIEFSKNLNTKLHV
jgi:hypothetical protein